MKAKTCLVCGESFPLTIHNKVYCSRRCRRKADRERNSKWYSRYRKDYWQRVRKDKVKFPILPKRACPVCGKTFTPKSNTAGWQKYCGRSCQEKCHRELQLIWQKNNPEKVRAAHKRHRDKKRGYSIPENLMRECVICGRNFPPKKNVPHIQKCCSPECSKELRKIKILRWTRENSRKVREKSKRWREKHPERAKETDRKYLKTFKGKINVFKKNNRRRYFNHFLKFNWEIAEKIINRDESCVYCGSEENLTFDHIVPVTHGGQTAYNNLVLCCKSCNTSKFNRDVLEWCEDRSAEVPEIVKELLEKQKEQKCLRILNKRRLLTLSTAGLWTA